MQPLRGRLAPRSLIKTVVGAQPYGRFLSLIIFEIYCGRQPNPLDTPSRDIALEGRNLSMAHTESTKGVVRWPSHSRPTTW